MSRTPDGNQRYRSLVLATVACLAALLFDLWAHREVTRATSALAVARRQAAAATARRDDRDRAYRQLLDRAVADRASEQSAGTRLARTAWFKDGYAAGRAFVRAHPEAQPMIDAAWSDLANSWPRADAIAAGFSPEQTNAWVALFQQQKAVIPYIYDGIRLVARNGGNLGPEAAQTTGLKNLVGPELYAKFKHALHDQSGQRVADLYAITADAGEPLTAGQMSAMRTALAAAKGSGQAHWHQADKTAAGILTPAQLQAFQAVEAIHTR